MKLQHIVGTLVGKVWRVKGWQSKTTPEYINMAPSSRRRSTDPSAGDRPPTNPAPPSPKALFKNPQNTSRTVSSTFRGHAVPCKTPAGKHHGMYTTNKASDSTTRPNRLHTHTHSPKRLAHPRSPIPSFSTLTARATLARPLHPAALSSVPLGLYLRGIQIQTRFPPGKVGEVALL
jgi:hypothetical protein